MSRRSCTILPFPVPLPVCQTPLYWSPLPTAPCSDNLLGLLGVLLFLCGLFWRGLSFVGLTLLHRLQEPFPQHGEKIRPDLAKDESHAEAWIGVNDGRFSL